MNKKSITCWVLILSLFTLVMSCKVDLGIPEKKMVAILVDIHMADGVMSAQGGGVREILTDSMQLYTPILQKHGYTLIDFREALNKYMKNPREFEVVYSKVISQLKNMQKPYAPAADVSLGEASRVKPQSMDELLHYELSVAGDTTLVWW